MRIFVTAISTFLLLYSNVASAVTTPAQQHTGKHANNPQHAQFRPETSISTDPHAVNPKAYPCPVYSDIVPCICYYEYDIVYNRGDMYLDCSAVTSDEELAAVFQKYFPVKEYHYFIMENNDKITRLNDILNGVTFRKIYLDVVENLEFISDYFLFDSENVLETITINYSKLTEDTFPFLSLDTFTNLKTVYLRGNQIANFPVIRSDSITEVSIIDSNITTLPFDSFHLLPNIDHWRCSNQQLLKLEYGTFALKNRYNLIDLMGNMISSTFGEGIFFLPTPAESTALNLYLSDNLLTSLPETVYGGIFPYLETLYISSNPLECGCDIAWIITNPEYRGKLDPFATCANDTLIADLDPGYYFEWCST